MDMIYLHVRDTDSVETIVAQATRQEANEIIKEFRKSKYEIVIISAKNIKTLQRVYGEFRPYKLDTVDNIIKKLNFNSGI